MTNRKSSLCKSLALAFVLSGFLGACQDSSKQNDTAASDSAAAHGADTSYNGLEGTRDQQGTGGTDVKLDTSSGQGAIKNQNNTKKNTVAGSK